MAFTTDSNCPQPLWQPPPTPHRTACGAASEAPFLLLHPSPKYRGLPPPLLFVLQVESVAQKQEQADRQSELAFQMCETLRDKVDQVWLHAPSPLIPTLVSEMEGVQRRMRIGQANLRPCTSAPPYTPAT